MFIAFFAYIFSFSFRSYRWGWDFFTIGIIFLISLLLLSAYIRKKKKHYAKAGKMVLYDDKVEIKTENRVEKIMLNENKVNANVRENNTDGLPMGTLSWLKGEVGNTITFTNGDKKIKYHFFIEKPSHVRLMVARFHEWKKGGIDCAWKVSDNVL